VCAYIPFKKYLDSSTTIAIETRMKKQKLASSPDENMGSDSCSIHVSSIEGDNHVYLNHHAANATQAEAFLNDIGEKICGDEHYSKYRITLESMKKSELDEYIILSTLYRFQNSKYSKDEFLERFMDESRVKSPEDMVVERQRIASHPLYVSEHEIGYLILEAFGENADIIETFLMEIAERTSSTTHYKEYQMTPSSLASACSFGLTADKIIHTLNKFSKYPVPPFTSSYIRRLTYNYGRASICVENKATYLICSTFEVAKTIIDSSPEVIYTLQEEGELDLRKLKFRVKLTQVGELRRLAEEAGFHLFEEFDYTEESDLPLLPGSLQLPKGRSFRPCQIKALQRMFYGSKARSGVIVLPCGAGKTLTGITASCTIGRSTLVLCNNALACSQWLREYRTYTTISPDCLFEFTGHSTPDLTIFNDQTKAIVLATTYHTLMQQDEVRRTEAQPIWEAMQNRTWGLFILDEAHMAPAEKFSFAMFKVTSCCKLGLTATLLREDGNINDLHYLIGPKLYDVPWQGLAAEGYVATVKCYSLICPFSSRFAREYYGGFSGAQARGQRLLYEANPNKLAAAHHIMEYHERIGDHILIFADSLPVLHFMKTKWKREMICGETPRDERDDLIRRFNLPTSNPMAIRTLILSRVGDIGLDLPEANVAIQVGQLGGSRRQESQRIGRVMRKKVGDMLSKAYFYSLVTRDMQDDIDSERRRVHLASEGYVYTHLGWETHFNFPQELVSEEDQGEYYDAIKSHFKSSDREVTFSKIC
jgi:DNA excision repair protein ERCC-3